jgi:tetratricopeptide (TPR) repeat protein
LLAIATIGRCAPAPPSLEELSRNGYRDLEAGRPDQGLVAAAQGRRRARDEGAEAWVRSFQVLEAEALVSQRRNAEALQRLDRAMAPVAPTDVVGTRALMTRALALCRSPGRSDEATADFEAASRAALELRSTRLAAEVALRRGSCHFLHERWSAAEADYRSTLEAARSEGATLLQAHAAGSIGLVLVRTGRYDEATDWLRRALQLASGPEAELARLKIMINAGWCDSLLGDYERAGETLRQAAEMAAARGLTGDRLVALTNLGNTHYKRGEHSRAMEDYEQALRIARELGSRADEALLLANLGAVALEQARYDDAAAFVARALPITRELKDEAGQQLCAFIEAEIAAGRGDGEAAADRYQGLIADPRTPAELLWEVHAALARAHVGAGRPAAAQVEFTRAFSTMERVRSSLGEVDRRITFSSSLRRFQDDYVDFLVSSGKQQEALLVADGSKGRSLSERLVAEGLTPRAVPSIAGLRAIARSTGATLVSYWVAPRRSFVWLVTPGGVEMRVLPGASGLGRDVEAYRAGLLRARDLLAEERLLGERLWRTLVPGSVGARLIVVPDGPLHLLNLEALVVPGAQPHYWLEDVTVVEAPSLALLREARFAGERGRARALIIGDPVPPNPEFPRLVHAAHEVPAIAELFGPERSTVYSGLAADPSCYRGARPLDYDFIHFAGHVVANRERPLDSAVVLSATREGYKLYAREIAGIPLRAELVTLSACRGAGSRTYAGEGLVGMAWAFLGAGAENVVGGLWDVEDASAAQLMEDVYRALEAGVDPAAAVREAKLRMLRSGTAFRKPFYWAPFVVYTGSARSLGAG